jgi:hypothetical protein
MLTRTKILLAVAAIAVLAPVTGAGAAPTAGTCVHSPNGAAVHLVGAGVGGTTFSCTYVAAGRGGISAATPNKWEMFNTRTGVVVADWRGLPVASTEGEVRPGDVIRITFFQELQQGLTGTVPAGTYGAIRAGGAGVAAG